MLETTTSGTRKAGDAGFLEHLRSFAATGFDYLGARIQLAGIESREASSHYFKILGFVFVGLFAVLFGYVFLCASLVFLIARVFQVHWEWVMLGCGALHIGGAALCIWIAKKRVTAPMFTATLNEFKKDQEWLRNRKSF